MLLSDNEINVEMAKLVPISKATNSYELLEEVIALVRAEPQRLDMSNWIYRLAGAVTGYPVELKPVCGTVGCEAGWIEVLRNPLNRVQGSSAFAKTQFPDDGGLQSSLHWDLFMFIPRGEGRVKLEPGTAAYVESVVANTRGFMAKYESELKAFELEPVNFTR